MRAITIVDAIVLNVIILAIGRVVTGEYPVVTVGGDDQTVGFASVIVTTAFAGLVAWGLLALLERVTARATAVWTAIAVAVFLLSLLGPLGAADTGSKVMLALLHIGAAVTIIPLMRRSTSDNA